MGESSGRGTVTEMLTRDYGKSSALRMVNFYIFVISVATFFTLRFSCALLSYILRMIKFLLLAFSVATFLHSVLVVLYLLIFSPLSHPPLDRDVLTHGQLYSVTHFPS